MFGVGKDGVHQKKVALKWLSVAIVLVTGVLLYHEINVTLDYRPTYKESTAYLNSPCAKNKPADWFEGIREIRVEPIGYKFQFSAKSGDVDKSFLDIKNKVIWRFASETVAETLSREGILTPVENERSSWRENTGDEDDILIVSFNLSPQAEANSLLPDYLAMAVSMSFSRDRYAVCMRGPISNFDALPIILERQKVNDNAYVQSVVGAAIDHLVQAYLVGPLRHKSDAQYKVLASNRYLAYGNVGSGQCAYPIFFTLRERLHRWLGIEPTEQKDYKF